MLREHHRFFRSLFQVLDALTVVLAWIIAFWIRFVLRPGFLPAPESGLEFRAYAPVAVPLIVIWFLSLQISGAYKSWRSSRIGLELFNVVKASLLAFLIFVSAQHFIARDELSRATILVFAAVVTIGLILNRAVLRATLSSLRKRGWNQRHVLFVGDAAIAETVETRLRLRPELGYQPLGLIRVSGEFSKETSQGSSTDGRALPVLGSLDQFEKILGGGKADQLLVCLRNQDVRHLDRILAVANEHNVHVRIVPDLSGFAVLGFQVEEFEGVPVISLNESPLVGWNSVIKRMTDVLYALFAIAVFSVPMLIITILVKLTSKGPIFYGQERMGLDGRTFKMWKFRSMRTDAEVQSGAVWAKEDDPRVTWVGGILRKTSLDELPQFFNVLVGDMSCVGPRPERPVFVDQFRKKIPGYMLRHKVKAGITGWAQINGFRGNTSLEGRIEYDLYYISNWSPLFDLKIMFLTLFKGFISPNAY